MRDESTVTKLAVRVYGICRNEIGEVLIADELIHGEEITKFPGGGLELGEGTIDCLEREFMEEMGCRIEIIRLIHVTSNFVVSHFNPATQVICIYYLVRMKDGGGDHVTSIEPHMKLRWERAIDTLPNLLTFQTDKDAALALLLSEEEL